MSLFGGQKSGGSLFGSNAQSNQQKPPNPFASFGNSQPAQQSGLFTASPTTSQTQGGGSLFSAAANTQPQQGAGLFGATTAQTQQSGSLFGASTPQTQLNKGLFGATATQSPQSGGMFGAATSQSQPSGGLFGAATTLQPQQNGGLFGASTSQPQQGGLFGATASQPQQSGGLFGATASQPQQSGGLFGATASQPQQSGGLFGAATLQSQPQQTGGLFGATNQQTSGGLFGNLQQAKPQQGISTGFGQNQDQTQKAGLFGSVQQSQPAESKSVLGTLGQNQTQPGSGGLFGGATTQTKPTLSLFGTGSNAQNQQSQQAQPSLFSTSSIGAAQNTPPKPLFGNTTTQQPSQPQNPLFRSSMGIPGILTLGQAAQSQQFQQQGSVPGVRIDVSNLRGTTRFNDLHEELQKQIEQIDAFIQQQIAFKDQCDAMMPAHEETLSTIPNDVDFVKTKLETTESVLDNDTSAINTIKTLIQEDAENARIGFRAVENLKLPRQLQYNGIWHPSTSNITPPRVDGRNSSSSQESTTQSTDLVSYFNAQISEFSKTLETYRSNISDIETHLGAVEATTVAQSQQLMFRKGPNGGTRSKEEQVRELASVLREFEGGILGVASKVGQVREAAVDVVEGGQGGALARRR